MSKNVKRMLALISFGFSYGFMYTLPYMKYSFYDQMIAAMKCTNEQLGSLLSVYAIACTISYLPGGWIADRFKPKNVLIVSSLANGVLCFIFMLTYTNLTIAKMIWFLCALSGGFAFWPAMLKGVRLMGKPEEQGRLYGIFEAINGLAGLLVNFVMILVLSIFSSDLIIGFKGAVASMGILCILAAVLLYFFYDGNFTENPGTVGSSAVGFSDLLTVFKIPGVWLVSLLMFGQVFFSAGMSYLTPYSTGVLGLSAAAAASIGSLRTYGTRFLGGPLGGYTSDKLFKSASKQQIFAFLLCGASMLVFLLVKPGSGTGGLLLAMLLIIGVAFYMEKGPMYAVIPELGVSPKVTGTAIALITLIGYTPDMFAHTMFGSWLDSMGDSGYTRIFIVTIIVTAVCAVLSFVCYRLSKRYMKSEPAVK